MTTEQMNALVDTANVHGLNARLEDGEEGKVLVMEADTEEKKDALNTITINIRRRFMPDAKWKARIHVEKM
jgi:hypothetical protein